MFFILFGLSVLSQVVSANLSICTKILAGSQMTWPCESAGSDWVWDNMNDAVAVDLRSNRPDGRRYQVLVLSPKDSAAYDETFRQVIAYFNAKHVPIYFVFFNYQSDELAAKFSIETAEAKGFDLIISVGSKATRYFHQNYDDGLPVVTACSKDPVAMQQVSAETGKSGTNIAYTSLNIEVGAQLSYIKEKFLTQLARVAVIYDKSNISSVQTQVEPLQRYLQNHPVEFIPIAVDMGSEKRALIESRLKSNLLRPMRSVVASSKKIGDTVFLITGSTELFNNIDIINAAAGNIPVLSVTPSHVDAGSQSVFMAIGVSFKNNAKIAADFAYKILIEGAIPGELPVGVVSTPDISINFSRAPQQGIKVPFYFFESAGFIYNHAGVVVRCNGRNWSSSEDCQ